MAVSDVALEEETEAYRVTLTSDLGAQTVIETGAPAVRLSAAELAARFGAAPGRIEASVAQLSRTVGAGSARRLTVHRP